MEKIDSSSPVILAHETWHYDLIEELDGNLEDYKASSGERTSQFESSQWSIESIHNL